MSDALFWSLIALIVGVFYYIIGDITITLMLKICLGFTAVYIVVIIINNLRYNKDIKIPLITLTIIIIACVYLFL